MISFIKGTIAEIETDRLIVECNNMGYTVFVPNSVIEYATRNGMAIQLYTYLSIKEDSISLFGFLEKEELNLFKQMISVSGIGPKGAIGILSALSVENLKIAIMSEDAKAIAKAPGIGAKTASKLILELKDKIDVSNLFQQNTTMTTNENQSIDNTIQGDAMDALMALGYSSSQALSALTAVLNEQTDITDVSELIKKALKYL